MFLPWHVSTSIQSLWWSSSNLLIFASSTRICFIVVDPDLGILLWKTNFLDGGGEFMGGRMFKSASESLKKEQNFTKF